MNVETLMIICLIVAVVSFIGALIIYGETFIDWLPCTLAIVCVISIISFFVLGIKWIKLNKIPYEKEGEIVSIEEIENFNITDIRIKYNNTSEENGDSIYIEGLEDYTYILIKYRVWKGNFYLNKTRLELRKKEN